jgi:glucosamine--fructose-6-phosphate aminotransferase (isomerizing)
MRGRLSSTQGWVQLGGITDYEQKLSNARRIIMVACGTSWHAGLVGEYLFEELARIPVEVEYASEFRYRNPIVDENDVVIAISQSGETADTLAAIQLAKAQPSLVFVMWWVLPLHVLPMQDRIPMPVRKLVLPPPKHLRRK